MPDLIRLSDDAAKIFVFDPVFPLGAAMEQAKRNKLNAFGRLARLNPFNRPKDETVLPTKHELRYEPFWYVVAGRDVDFSKEITYAVDVGNPHAHKVLLDGREYPVNAQGKRRVIDLPAIEFCRRKIDYVACVDGLGRELKKGILENYVGRPEAREQAVLNLPGAVLPQLRAPTVRQKVDQILSSEVINAHEVQRDERTLEKFHLYYRPVFAFEFAWTTEDKLGVIEVDGISGEVAENGQWFKEKIDAIMTREMLFEAGAEIAGAFVPGGGLAVKVIEIITAPPDQKPL
ncbi:hypothetical protein [Azohydromonas caseinilytica]|uniref:Uncharacterized protein n=1 Tax=Azohydromonas caseinilytica TaxID=2728836 RepID=A0A848F8G9_9BURK|nr:hypothetical protein [Azohydromonas caseinilytica]NML15652.1 hypothetical protein [Azohydromonas caseinilytica]